MNAQLYIQTRQQINNKKMHNRLPDFIIVGAMKSGTTTLAHSINQHPQVAIPKKEIHYFDNLSARSLDWYGAHFQNLDGYIVGEATPTYSYLPYCPHHIYKICPNTKLLWIFRDPIRRSFSNYLHAFKKGLEPRTFTEAVSQELYGSETPIYRQYINRSIYADQVARYQRYFPKKQMHYVSFEELANQDSQALQDVFSFLGVSKNDFKTTTSTQNRTKIPHFLPIIRLLNTIFGNNAIINGISQKLIPQTKKTPKLKEHDIEILSDFFTPHNLDLDRLTGKNFSDSWLKK